ncbi:hypothetical protein C2S52_003808 [Perilla frutescens var. hirtella]|nr:hypothetical protein C2S52_003808 [Perilla frutescens var. hirtella]
MSEIKDFGDPNNFGACNMRSQEVTIAAACALGQLEAHVKNFGDAEEILTTTLKQMEEHFGPQHPKVGVILTYIALMYRLKSMAERSSSPSNSRGYSHVIVSIAVTYFGLFKKAIELLKAPSLEVDGRKLI